VVLSAYPFIGALRRLVVRHSGVVLVMTCVATVAPVPFLFACACTCPPGPPPSTVPEAPWQPLLLLVGVAGLFLWRRGRRGGGDGGAGPSSPARSRRLGGGLLRHLLLAVRVFAVVVLTSIAVGAASAAVSAATPLPGTEPPCDCNGNGNGNGHYGIQSSNGVPTPSVGSGEILHVAIPMLAGGLVLVGGSVLLRPRRRTR
jgi:MYXO-CTERM domain-containing protein